MRWLALLLVVGVGTATAATRITVNPNTILTIKGQHTTCTATDILHCWQTGRWPRLEWVLYKDTLSVLRVDWPGGPAQTLFEARR